MRVSVGKELRKRGENMKLYELLDAIKKDVQAKTGDDNPEVYFTSDVHDNEVEGGDYGGVYSIGNVAFIEVLHENE